MGGTITVCNVMTSAGISPIPVTIPIDISLIFPIETFSYVFVVLIFAVRHWVEMRIQL
jgi:hypothetical protein